MLLALTAPAFAATLSVAVEFSGGGETQRALAIRVETIDGTAVEAIAAPSRSAQIDLQPGTYRVRLAEPHFWAEARDVYVGPDGTFVHLTVYRETTVEGRVTAAGKVPNRLTARFQSADGGTPHGETVCAIVRRSFSCRVPAVRLDVALKAQGYVTRYRWGVDTSAKPADIGTIDLVPGAVLTGHVTGQQRGVPLEKVVVRATPRRSAPSFDTAGDERR